MTGRGKAKFRPTKKGEGTKNGNEDHKRKRN